MLCVFSWFLKYQIFFLVASIIVKSAKRYPFRCDDDGWFVPYVSFKLWSPSFKMQSYWYWIRMCCLRGGPGTLFSDEELMLDGSLSVQPFCCFAKLPKNVSLTLRTPRSYMARANSGSISLSSHSTQSWQLFPITLYLEEYRMLSC